MRILQAVGMLSLATCLGNEAGAQIKTLSDVASNATMKALIMRSNAQANAQAAADYLRLHPSEATNALTQRQLELLDISHDPTKGSDYFSKAHSPEELQEFTNTVWLYLTNAAAQSSYSFHRHGMSDAEYRSNFVYALQHAPPPKPWPDASRKQAIFEHCAMVLRSAIDTNQIQTACDNLTNQLKATSLRNVVNEAFTNLDMFAALLLNPEISSFVGVGYEARISNTANSFNFRFWPEKGPAGIVVRDLEKRTADGMHVLVSANFNENGKLLHMNALSPDNGGVLKNEMRLNFNEDGTLRSYWKRAP